MLDFDGSRDLAMRRAAECRLAVRGFDLFPIQPNSKTTLPILADQTGTRTGLPPPPRRKVRMKQRPMGGLRRTSKWSQPRIMVCEDKSDVDSVGYAVCNNRCQQIPSRNDVERGENQGRYRILNHSGYSSARSATSSIAVASFLLARNGTQTILRSYSALALSLEPWQPPIVVFVAGPLW
jgi:hypothetical protein